MALWNRQYGTLRQVCKEEFMATFLNNVLTANFALVFVAMLFCLVAQAYPGFQARATGGFAWLLWFLGGVLCLIVCVKIAFGV